MKFVPTALSMTKKLSDSRSKYELFVSLGIGDRKGTEIILRKHKLPAGTKGTESYTS